MDRALKIGILEGDDIGLEVVPETIKVMKAAAAKTGLAIEWFPMPIGKTAFDKLGYTLPPGTLEKLFTLDGWVLGPIGHQAYPKDNPNAINPHPILRKNYDLFANIRPSKSLPGVPALYPDVDLVIVENLASLPLNLDARDALYEVLADRAAIFRHHDLPWQRPHLQHLEGPAHLGPWAHVTINDRSRVELLQRGIVATTIPNHFDCDPPQGRRDLMRHAVHIKGNSRLIMQPTRAIPRKNVTAGLRLAEKDRKSTRLNSSH